MSKKSIILWFLFLFTIGLSITSIAVKAHNPVGLQLSYDKTTKQLNATITHNVGDPNNHYIESVDIKVNGSTVRFVPYTSQPSTNTFTYVYNNITAIEGETIQVKATCSISGSITRSLVVGDGQLPNGGAQIPGYIGILLILSISIVATLSLVYKKVKLG
ncbi:MAG: hypothetical protein ACXABO_11875 [Promethearchaeota archaeon]|jgi:hypothetical protein